MKQLAVTLSHPAQSFSEFVAAHLIDAVDTTLVLLVVVCVLKWAQEWLIP